jgi:hypothetical protein
MMAFLEVRTRIVGPLRDLARTKVEQATKNRNVEVTVTRVEVDFEALWTTRKDEYLISGSASDIKAIKNELKWPLFKKL